MNKQQNFVFVMTSLLAEGMTRWAHNFAMRGARLVAVPAESAPTEIGKVAEIIVPFQWTMVVERLEVPEDLDSTWLVERVDFGRMIYIEGPLPASFFWPDASARRKTDLPVVGAGMHAHIFARNVGSTAAVFRLVFWGVPINPLAR